MHKFERGISEGKKTHQAVSRGVRGAANATLRLLAMSTSLVNEGIIQEI